MMLVWLIVFGVGRALKRGLIIIAVHRDIIDQNTEKWGDEASKIHRRKNNKKRREKV